MQHVLPRVHDDYGSTELDGGYGIPVHKASHGHLPRSKGGDESLLARNCRCLQQRGVFASDDNGRKYRLRSSDLGSQRDRVDAYCGQDVGNRALGKSELLRVPSHIVLGFAGCRRLVD